MLTDRSEKQGLVANRLMEEGVWHTFEFGPVLVENGEAIPLHSSILRVDEGYLEPAHGHRPVRGRSAGTIS